MNLPNKITTLRLLLVPIYVGVFLYTDARILATLLFSIAAMTDFLDGYLARKMGLVTDLGKLLDPLADKILTISSFVLFVSIGRLSAVPVIIVITRELFISIFRAIAAGKQHVIAASVYGKTKTILQISLLITLHLYWLMERQTDIILQILVWAMTAITLFSALDYLWKNREVL
jgi:CDP-diacylglycerol--glycerol-3-phosphate 3-phosphatidyltransferase